MGHEQGVRTQALPLGRGPRDVGILRLADRTCYSMRKQRQSSSLTLFPLRGRRPLFVWLKRIILPRQARDKHRESTQNREATFFFLRSWTAGEGSGIRGPGLRLILAGAKNAPFFEPFVVDKNDHFAKTGSGQRWGKQSKKEPFFQASRAGGGCRRRRSRRRSLPELFHGSCNPRV